MDQWEVIYRLRNLLPELRNAADPAEALLKHARAENLSTAQLERMGVALNTTIAVGHYKRAGAEEREDCPTIVNVPELLKRYATYRAPGGVVKSASEASQGHDFRLPPLVPTFVKSAHVVEEPAVCAMSLLKEARDLNVANVEETANLEQALFSARMAEYGLLTKLAQVIRKHGPAAINDMECVTMSVTNMSGLTKSAFDALAEHCRTVESLGVLRSDNAKPEDWVPDTYGIAKDASALVHNRLQQEALQIVLAARSTAPKGLTEVEFMVKSAVVANPPNPNPTQTPSRQTPPEPGHAGMRGEPSSGSENAAQVGAAPKATESDTQSALLKQLIQTAATGGTDAAGRAMEQVPTSEDVLEKYLNVFGTGKKDRQMQVSRALQETRESTSLQELVLRDPVIRDAPPEKVAELFETIRATNPGVARDSRMLGFVLREALQYGAVPTHGVEALTTIRQRGSQARKDEQATNSAKYAAPTSVKK